MQSQDSTCSKDMIVEILPSGEVVFPNVLSDEYDLLDELGEYKDHEPVEGYEHIYRPHLCA